MKSHEICIIQHFKLNSIKYVIIKIISNLH